MTTRREPIIALGARAIAPLAAIGQQQPVRVARVASRSYRSDPDPGLALLREGMHQSGWVEGKSYVMVARYAGGNFTRLPVHVDEPVTERIDAIVSPGPACSEEMTKEGKSGTSWLALSSRYRSDRHLSVLEGLPARWP
jgi:hypothetical protein